MTSINTNTPSTTIRNNKRRRPISISTTTKLLIGVAATTLFNNNNQLIIEAKHPPSIHKNTKKNKHSTIRGNTNKPLVPANNNILIPLGSSNSNSINNEINGNDTLLLGSINGGGNVNNGGRVIVVQPNNLESAHVASEWGGTEQLSSSTNNNNSIQQNNNKLQGSSSSSTYHSWPHPDTFQDESSIKAHNPLDPSLHPGQDQNPNRNVLQPMAGSTSNNSGGEELKAVNGNKMGKGQMGGHSTKFHGWVLGSTGIESGNGGVVVQPNNLGAQEPSGGGGESGVHYYQPSGYGASSQTQVNQPPQGSSSSGNVKGSSEKYDTIIETAVVGSAEVAAELLGSPLDEDVGHSVQVIVRPRLTNDDGEVVNSPLGSGSSSSSVNNKGGGSNEPVVYYYDPAALQSSASSSTNGQGAGEESSTPELTLPETVYDISGQALKLEDVHNGGKNEVFLEVQPRAVWGANSLSSGGSSSRGGAHMSDRLSSLQAKLQFTSSSGSSSTSSSGTQSQDQLIVFFTIATMAVMVGMLSAQRLRSKKLLESCMGLDDDDDEEEEEWTPNPIFGGQGQQQQQVRYDKKFDTETTGLSPRGNNGPTSPSNSSDGGFGALLGGRNSIGQGSSSNYYGTNDGGGLHFRGIGGDLEKFDV